MEITKLSSKGQIVLPIRIREELGIEEGSVLAVDSMNEIIIIKKIDVDLINQFNKSLDNVKKGKIKRVYVGGK